MGRKAKIIDPDILREFISHGKTQKEIANELGICPTTIARRIAALRVNEGPLKQFRNLQGLCLTNIQAKTLEAITSENIEKATLGDLAKAYNILQKCEKHLPKYKGKITGLTDYLLQIYKDEFQA